MVKYENACVYKICCKDPDIKDVYIGSTCNLIRRRAHHKQSCNNENDKSFNVNVYKFIRDHGGWNNWIVLKIKDTPVDNVGELRLKEREEFEKVGAKLNSNYPQRSLKEYRKDTKEILEQKAKQYYDDNKEEILDYHKEYYQDNKEKIAEYHKGYREQNKEVLSKKNQEYYENNKEHISQQNKEYYENNKEHISQWMKEYRENNKEHLNQQKKEKVECEICGSVVTKNHLSRHKNSKKCKKHLLE